MTEMECRDIGCTVENYEGHAYESRFWPPPDRESRSNRSNSQTPLPGGPSGRSRRERTKSSASCWNQAHFEDPTILVEYSKELKQTIVQGQANTT